MSKDEKSKKNSATWVLVGLIFIGLLALILFRHGTSGDPLGDAQKEVLEQAELTPEKKFLEAIRKKGQAANPYRNDSQAIEAGAGHFRVICSKCHRKDATGAVGPNLVDSTWLHGGSDTEVYRSIMEGVPLKKARQDPPQGSMPSYSSMLGVKKTLEVMAWLASINPAWSGEAQ